MHFAVHICYYIYIYRIKNKGLSTASMYELVRDTQLYGFSNVHTSIHVPQKRQYQTNSGLVSKNQHPKPGTSLLPICVYDHRNSSK